jgi:hypothetical protein
MEKKSFERSAQLELLKKLEETVKGAWNFQKGLRNIHNNLNNPAYAAERDKIDAYATNLKQYIDRIKTILTSLRQHFDYSKNQADEYFINIEKQLNADITKLLDDNIKLSKEVEDELNDLKGTVVYAELHQEYETLRVSSIDNISKQSGIKDNEKKILKAHKDIRDADSKNLRDIDEALRIVTNDPLKKLTFANRAGNAVPMGLFNDNTLYQLNDLIIQLRKSVENIISIEDSGEGKTAIEERNKNLDIAKKLDKELRKKYGEFEAKVFRKTREYYNIVNKLFLEKGLALLKVAETLKADKSIDPGLKSKEINDAKIAIANIEKSIIDSRYKEDKLVKSVLTFAQSLEKMRNSFITKDGKINGKTQSNINAWITGLSQKIENIKNTINKEDKESKPLQGAFENLSSIR